MKYANQCTRVTDLILANDPDGLDVISFSHFSTKSDQLSDTQNGNNHGFLRDLGNRRPHLHCRVQVAEKFLSPREKEVTCSNPMSKQCHAYNTATISPTLPRAKLKGLVGSVAGGRMRPACCTEDLRSHEFWNCTKKALIMCLHASDIAPQSGCDPSTIVYHSALAASGHSGSLRQVRAHVHVHRKSTDAPAVQAQLVALGFHLVPVVAAGSACLQC